MKINATPDQIQTILKALALVHVKPFEDKSSDPKSDAQRNLGGRTHYYDDDTLRWHKSRVLSTDTLADGLLFKAITSEGGDYQNTFRVYRVVVHDVFGTCVTRPDLENAPRSKAAAIRQFEAGELDLVAHYREALQREFDTAARTAAQFEDARNLLAA